MPGPSPAAARTSGLAPDVGRRTPVRGRARPSRGRGVSACSGPAATPHGAPSCAAGSRRVAARRWRAQPPLARRRQPVPGPHRLSRAPRRALAGLRVQAWSPARAAPRARTSARAWRAAAPEASLPPAAAVGSAAPEDPEERRGAWAHRSVAAAQSRSTQRPTRRPRSPRPAVLSRSRASAQTRFVLGADRPFLDRMGRDRPLVFGFCCGASTWCPCPWTCLRRDADGNHNARAGGNLRQVAPRFSRCPTDMAAAANPPGAWRVAVRCSVGRLLTAA
jgi:hypothetical protein